MDYSHKHRGADRGTGRVIKYDGGEQVAHVAKNALDMTNDTHDSFAVGGKVVLQADPTVIGVVTGETRSDREPKYEVFCADGRTRTLYQSQLELAPVESEMPRISVDELKATLTATQLSRPSARHLYSLSASRIDFIPYQFRPVMKLIQSDRPRLLIADEVGVGKTIEAGLIIKELDARREIESILIICPKPLVTENKWRDEMRRFDESFQHLDGKLLQYCIDETHFDGVWPEKFSRAILPYSLLDEKLMRGSESGPEPVRGLTQLEQPPKFDLIIVDEAHHVRNTNTWRHQNVEFLVNNAEAVVFLSATPIQTHQDDLFTLLKLLRPDVFAHKNDFERIGSPNPTLNSAASIARAGDESWVHGVREKLAEAVATDWGEGVLQHNPLVGEISDLLDATLTPEVRVRVIRALEALHTFSSFLTRTRRRDIGDFTVRKPRTVEVEFTEEQASVHEQLIELCGDISATRHGARAVPFLVSGLRRQAASCMSGLAPLLSDMLNRRLSGLEDSGDDIEDIQIDAIVIDEFRGRIEGLAAEASLMGERDDLKFDALERVIRERLELPNPKVLLFTSYRHTIAYLQRRLVDAGIRTGQVNGEMDDPDRREIRRRFKLPGGDREALDIMLSTEVGTEGLDFQFCDMLVNYDLPWNPMRIEQRIGRIDRHGQEAESVAIVNLITKGTVDADIYERCLLRIGVFERSLGGSEAILGDIAVGINAIAEDLTLTDSDRRKKLQQLADNEINEVEEQLELEQEQSSLFGLETPISEDGETLESVTNSWLTPSSVAHMVVEYLALIDSGKRVNLTKAGSATLRLSREVKDRLLNQLDLTASRQISDQAWKQWLRGAEQTCQVTVDTETARDTPQTHLLSPTHPLVRAAAAHLRRAGPVVVSVKTHTSELPNGRHPFAIYGWNRIGLRGDYRFHVVAADGIPPEMVVDSLTGMTSVDGDEWPSTSETEMLEGHQYDNWLVVRERHQQQMAAYARSLLDSLTTTSKANLHLLVEQRGNVIEPKIRLMRESQIAAAEADFVARRERLEKLATQADIESELLVVGVLEVVA